MNGTAPPSSSSEYDSEDSGEEEVENFSAYGQQKKIEQQIQMDA